MTLVGAGHVAPLLRALVLLIMAASAGAQSLEERLDEELFVRELSDLGLGRLVEHYGTMRPPSPTLNHRIRIARHRIGALDPGRALDDRAASLAAMLEAREQLIALAPDDPRRAVWLGDQAEDLLLLALPLRGDDLRGSFGIVPPETHAALASVTGRAAAAARAATSAARLELERGERSAAPPWLRARLRDEELAWRLPLLDALARVYEAEWALSPPEAQVAQEVQEAQAARRRAADDLLRLLPRIPAPLRRAARGAAALALLRLEALDEAETLAAELASDPLASPVDHLRALAIEVEVVAQREGPGAALRLLSRRERDEIRRGGLFAGLLLAAQRLRLAETAGPFEEARAYATYRGLAEERVLLEQADRAAIRAAVLQRLADAGAQRTARIEAHPLVATAVLERSAPGSALSRRAVEALEHFLEGDGLADDDRLAASMALARAYAAQGEVQLEVTVRSIRRLLDGAAGNAATDQAGEAIDLATALAVDLARRTPGSTEALDMRRRALDVALDRSPPVPSLDRWRCEASRVALESGEASTALALATRVPPGSAWYADAAFLAAAAARTVAFEAAPRERERAWSNAVQRAREAISAAEAAVARTSDDTLRRRLDDLAARSALLHAEALLRAGDATASLAALEAMAGRPELNGTLRGEMLRLRIAGLDALGRPGEAASTIEAYTRAAPDRAWVVAAALLRNLEATRRELLAELRDEEAVALAREKMLPLAASLEATLADPARRSSDRLLDLQLTRLIAEARLAAGEARQALRGFDDVLREQPDALEALLGRAEALFTLNEEEGLAEAMTIYKRIASGRAAAADEAFWLSELRMLQVLDRVERRSEQIRPRIDQLRARDPALGGERFRREFERLAARHR